VTVVRVGECSLPKPWRIATVVGFFVVAVVVIVVLVIGFTKQPPTSITPTHNRVSRWT